MNFAKPKILISSCINFAACRYNGQKIESAILKKMQPFVDIVNVCPEVEIGLWIPRLPIHLEFNGKDVSLIQSSTKINVANKMKNFSKIFLKWLVNFDGAILKSKSPSCGISNVKMQWILKKDNPFGGMGMFTYYLNKEYPFLAIEDEWRLLNYEIREIFFTKLFCLAAFRELKNTKNIKNLIMFHSQHKYLFMRYHTNKLTILWRIIANYNKSNLEETFVEYEAGLKELLMNMPNKVKAKNVLNHMYGYFKTKLSQEEKDFFFASIDMYLEERIPFSNLITMIKTRALNYKEDYILQQKILNPFPTELLNLADSGNTKIR